MPSRVGSFSPASPTTRPLESKPATFKASGSLDSKMKEASDVVALPNGVLAVVGDTSDELALVSPNGSVERLKLPQLKNGKSQLEGVAYDPEKHQLLVSREEKGELLRYEWNPSKSKGPKLAERLELDLDGPKNKGVEGLAYVPAGLSPTGQAGLLLAKEGKPRELSMVSAKGTGKPLPVKLDPEVRDVCGDFSAVAVDPRTGHVFISSDESGTVAQVKLVRDGNKLRGQLVHSFPVRGENGKRMERIEGLTFDAKGNLFILTENDGKLHRFARQ